MIDEWFNVMEMWALEAIFFVSSREGKWPKRAKNSVHWGHKMPSGFHDSGLFTKKPIWAFLWHIFPGCFREGDVLRRRNILNRSVIRNSVVSVISVIRKAPGN